LGLRDGGVLATSWYSFRDEYDFEGAKDFLGRHLRFRGGASFSYSSEEESDSEDGVVNFSRRRFGFRGGASEEFDGVSPALRSCLAF
jgi:hypothetical protein